MNEDQMLITNAKDKSGNTKDNETNDDEARADNKED